MFQFPSTFGCSVFFVPDHLIKFKKVALCNSCNGIFLFSFRTRPKVQFNGYVGHESSNGQASFENPMYDTNMKPTEAKAVRFDTTLNTVCTVV